MIPALTGFGVAFLAEPIKNQVQHKKRRELLRQALYKEVLLIDGSLRFFLENSGESYIDLKSSIPNAYPVFEHALKNPILFYELREAVAISKIHKNLQILLSSSEGGTDKEKAMKVAKVIRLQNKALFEKDFNQKKLLKLSS